jgi:hypothetical protein
VNGTGFASVQVALSLDEDCAPGFLDGKLRFTVEDDCVMIHADRKKDGTAYILAEAPLADFQRMMRTLGIMEQKEAANEH